MWPSSNSTPPPQPGERLEREAFDRYFFRWFYAVGLVAGVVLAATLAWLFHLTYSDWIPELISAIAVIGMVALFFEYRRTGIGIRPLLIGARGEREVAAILDELRSKGYFVYTQVPIPRTPQGNDGAHSADDDRYAADNVIVGPAGVYVIESKRRSKLQGKLKRIEYDGERLTENGFAPDKCPLRQVTGYATGLGKYLRTNTRLDIFVRGVVLYTGADVRERSGTGAGSRPWVLAPHRLAAWLQSELSHNDPSRDMMRLPLTKREIEAFRRAITKLQLKCA
jgi:hypothetical protein